MQDNTTYRFAKCSECGRELIVPRIDGWTGRELPKDTTYTCVICQRKRAEAFKHAGEITPLPSELIDTMLGHIWGCE